MKKIYFIIISLMIVTTVGFWLGIRWYLKSVKTLTQQNQDETANWQKYRKNSPYGSFEIKVPTSWRTMNEPSTEDKEPIIVRFEKSANKNDRFPALAIRAPFIYSTYEKSKDFNQELSESNFIDFISYYYQIAYQGNSLEQLGITLPTTTLPFAVDNRPAARIIINKNLKKPLALVEDTWVPFFEKKTILKFSCQLTDQQDSRTRDECNKMIKTFKIIPDKATDKTTNQKPESKTSSVINQINAYNYWPDARWVPGHEVWICEQSPYPGCYYKWKSSHYE